MIHRLNALSLSEKLHESMQDSGEDLRFAAIEANLAEYADKCATWHWHEFVEFACVLEGEQECCTPGGVTRLRPGDGYFVNASVLHLNRMVPGCSRARLRVFQFETALLTGAGAAPRRYVAPVERCASLEILPLRREDPAHRPLLDALSRLFGLCEQEPRCYELDVLALTFLLWRQLYQAAEPLLTQSAPGPEAPMERLKALLTHVHLHFAEPLSVPELARAAHISEREVYRAFRQGLDTTPTLYLLRHRLNHAARMLAEGDASVTEISIACGFSSPSYFCKAFHDLTGLSPRDFRRANRVPTR